MSVHVLPDAAYATGHQDAFAADDLGAPVHIDPGPSRSDTDETVCKVHYIVGRFCIGLEAYNRIARR
jgi:hypothetical protein